MSQRRVEQCIKSMKVDMIIEKEHVVQGVRVLDGRFRSPHAIMFPNQLPGCLQWARWRAYLPNTARKGVCIHLAGTGDHSYIRRELGFVKGLLEEGIGSVLVQNPFYADRKPMSQFRSSLENVSDLFVMGAALISECNYLISWAISEGYGPMALSGVSMGGFMASLAATNVCIPIGVVPCMSWTTAAPAFTEGALRDAINYGQLQQQLEDRLYLDKLRSIPNVNWVDEMYERNKVNSLGLAHNMMCTLMNEFTCLANYPIPLDTSLCTAIVAEHDAYVLRPHGALDFAVSVTRLFFGFKRKYFYVHVFFKCSYKLTIYIKLILQQIWPGMCVIKMERMGHVTAYLNGHHLFRKTIAQTLRHMEENSLGE
ncbi:unnamed protein product [Angiostrongylus costaricensis]|uniref:Protein ABHD18 n=1 Tax=Angiostrongylus costaricensis TaxID=334426 RepID=A0A0R3PGU3_ANGCS|nr:unnamed protein product [Angiostrongylus costaricensis]